MSVGYDLMIGRRPQVAPRCGNARPEPKIRVALPVDVVSGEARKLPYPQAGVEERSHDKSLRVRRARLGYAGGFLLGERLTLILVGHAVYCTACDRGRKL